jgi:KaiC/GvpD/RAD55 family RecA-like ATPase
MDGFDRICTGVAGLDSQLGGGVPPGTSILLIAESTNALYKFLDEIAAFGMQQKQEVFWLELDRPWALVQDSLETTIEGKSGNLTVLNGYEPHLGDESENGDAIGMETIAPGEVPDVTTDRLSGVEHGNYRMVLTSLSSLMQSMGEDAVLDYVRQVVALGQDLGGLQIFTIVKDAHPPETLALFKHICTAVFELGMERKGFGLYSYLKIEKLLGVPDAANLMLFDETDEGLRLENTKRVF